MVMHMLRTIAYAYAYATIAKNLSFFPVKFGNEFNIAFLTHKCLHVYASTYLKNSICSRSGPT